MNIIEFGDKFTIYPDMIKLHKELTAGKVYILDFDAHGNPYLKKGEALQLPGKIYDNSSDFRQQVLRTLEYEGSKNNVGVLLCGYKGQGKSVDAKLLAIESGLPIVMITASIHKDNEFASFLNSIHQPYVLLIDEFEKIFNEKDDKDNPYHSQNVFLNMLDGVMSSRYKRLTILTTNEEIGDKFINRPSRIRYYKQYSFLDKVIYKAIVEDMLVNKEFQADLEEHLDMPSCTIDLITTIIEEINIQDKPYSSFKSIFNHKPKKISYSRWKKDTDNKFTYVDDVESEREIGVDGENFHRLEDMYNAKLLHNDGKHIFYEKMEYLTQEDEDNDNDYKRVKVIYKLIKQDYVKKESLVF